MKTAEEWAAQIGAKITKQDGFPLMPSEYVVIINQIQLDAMREGMRRASRYAALYSNADNSESRQIEQAILTAAEQLTEKDL